MRKIKKLHKAVSAPIADLVTYRAMPTPSLDIGDLDPFLFLNHHGHQHYKPHNQGLPFGPHPHRGFETVTFILEGDIMHKDTGGYESTIEAGGIQWMTAGRGLIHAEVSSPKFKENGGNLEILQLWVNLPAKDKMAEPTYIGLQQADIPSLTQDDGRVKINLISGHWENEAAPIQSLGNINLASIYFSAGGQLRTNVPTSNAIFLYVVKGQLNINGQEVTKHHLVQFENNAEEIEIQASSESIILFGHAKPFGEPVVAYGPFVMNSEAEIKQAYADYQQGKFGVWRD